MSGWSGPSGRQRGAGRDVTYHHVTGLHNYTSQSTMCWSPGRVTSESSLRSLMKITDVRARLLSYLIPPERRHRNDYGWVVKHDTIIVEVETDEHIIGIGTGIGRAESIKSIIESQFRESLIGEIRPRSNGCGPRCMQVRAWSRVWHAAIFCPSPDAGGIRCARLQPSTSRCGIFGVRF